jgi:hypothetical protein
MKFAILWGSVVIPLACAGLAILAGRYIHPYLYIFSFFFVIQAINHAVGDLWGRWGGWKKKQLFIDKAK